MHAIWIAVQLTRTMRKKQYLYFKDHRRRIVIQVVGLVSFMVFNIIHVLYQLAHKVEKVEDSSTEYVLYFGFELFAIAVFAYSKITEDLFL